MSLGIKSLWRAPSYTTCVQQLSLVSRVLHNPLYLQQEKSRRWLSTPTTNTDRSLVGKVGKNDFAGLRKVEILKSSSQLRRALLRQIIKKRSGSTPKRPELVRRLDKSSSKYGLRRSLRRRWRSAARQHLLDHLKDAEIDLTSDWRSTLDFLWRHTHEFGDILHFRVVIGRGAAAEARSVLSMPDTHLWHIRQRNQSAIRIEEVGPHNKELVLSLSGSERSIRRSLLEIVKAVGKLTAIRLLDPTWKGLLTDIWRGSSTEKSTIRLLADGEAVVDDKTMTVRGDHDTRQAWVSKPPTYTKYWLTRRADDIPVPKVWTKHSFEEYVAALVHGQVPTHLARSLYPDLPDHQEVVVSLLIELFTSEDARPAVSLSALKMALRYIQKKGPGFRPAARELFHQVELLNIPADAETFNIFLVGSSQARDLDAFNSMLRLMVRKGRPPESSAWIAFMEMIQPLKTKRYIARMMIAKGLGQNLSTLNAIGRQMAIVNLEHDFSTEFDAQKYMSEQNKKYGTDWINLITLNKIVDFLGSQGKLDACADLLNLIYTSRIIQPNTDTLNTMLTHGRGLEKQLTTLRWMTTQWPNIIPDSWTYHMLFRTTWTRRLPNMIRVLWRYAALANLTHPKITYTLTRLLRQEHHLSARRAFLKAWEDLIFGRAELAAMRALHGGKLMLTHVVSEYTKHARLMRPSESLAAKLQEAFYMDMKIHGLVKEGAVMSSSLRDSLSVDIPLEPKPSEQPPSSSSMKREGLFV
ncbi:hypothetical protein F5B20DRAFT_137555 [Whalleya microplaca]|nr:hypothetical protein F5B20DRAFT_137555 [Whalleya microplaca]